MLPLHPQAQLVDIRLDKSVGASELEAMIVRRAADLTRAGIAVGDRVAVRGRGTIGFFTDLFGAWHAGAAVACLSASLTPGEVRRLIDFVDARCLLDEDGMDLTGAKGARATGPLSIDHTALILFTSGTTGDPKGVTHTFRSLLARTALNAMEIGSSALSHTLNVLPVHFGHGLIGNCLTPLLAGGKLHLWESPSLSELGGLGAVLDDRGISFMSSVPSFWTLARRLSKPPGGRSLQRVHVGSAPLSLDQWGHVARWAGTDRLFNAYGITETANWIGGGRMVDDGAQDGYVGRPWGGTWAVRDDAGTVRLRDGVGEIIVATPSLMSGYLNRPDLTDAAFSDGWFNTGDIGRIDDDGTLTIVGRRKDEINRAGIKVHPEEIDLLLQSNSMVADVCTFGEPDPASGEIVGVAIVLRGGAAGSDPLQARKALEQWAKERIRAECVPTRWYFLSSIPRTDRGKLKRSVVRDHCRDQGDKGDQPS